MYPYSALLCNAVFCALCTHCLLCGMVCAVHYTLLSVCPVLCTLYFATSSVFCARHVSAPTIDCTICTVHCSSLTCTSLALTSKFASSIVYLPTQDVVLSSSVKVEQVHSTRTALRTVVVALQSLRTALVPPTLYIPLVHTSAHQYGAMCHQIAVIVMATTQYDQ